MRPSKSDNYHDLCRKSKQEKRQRPYTKRLRAIALQDAIDISTILEKFDNLTVHQNYF